MAIVSHLFSPYSRLFFPSALLGHYYEKKAVYVQKSKKCISLVDLDIKRGRIRSTETVEWCFKKIAGGDYDVQITYDEHIEEIQNAIDNFNFMAHELNSVEIMRNDFVANVSHEFKTPLSSISGYVTLLQLSRLENQSSLPTPVTYRLDEQIRATVSTFLFAKPSSNCVTAK